jgi:hypothetical protein
MASAGSFAQKPGEGNATEHENVGKTLLLACSDDVGPRSGYMCGAGNLDFDWMHGRRRSTGGLRESDDILGSNVICDSSCSVLKVFLRSPIRASACLVGNAIDVLTSRRILQVIRTSQILVILASIGP